MFDRIILGSNRPTLFRAFQNYITDYEPIYNGHSKTWFPIAKSFPGVFELKTWGIYNKLSKEKTYTIHEKKMISDKSMVDRIRKQKCLIPCNAISIVFDKERLLIRSTTNRLIALAGIYEHNTFAVFTKKPNVFFRQYNQSEEPVILTENHFEQWFKPGHPIWAFADYSEELKFDTVRISNDISDITKNNKEILTPLPEDKSLGYDRNRFKKSERHWGDDAMKEHEKNKSK